MFAAFGLAIAQLTDRAFRRPLILGLTGAILVFAGLWAGLWVLAARTRLFETGWLNTASDALGGLVVLALTVILYPAVAAGITSLFLDSAIEAVERRHYPALPPPRQVTLGEQARSALRLTLVSVALNLLALPIYLVPAINLVVFYGLNGYILGREYFEMVAIRRLDSVAARHLWRSRRIAWLVMGAAIAFISTLPVINLVAPLVGVAAMTHRVVGAAFATSGRRT